MSYAPNYSPTVGFATEETNNVAGRSTVRTTAVDNELANISTSINALNTNLKALQRDDGKPKDLLIEPYALSEQTRALIATGGTTPRGTWAQNTDYSYKDVVQYSNIAQVCLAAHNSGTVFTQAYWLPISGDGTSAANAAAAAASASAASGSASASAASATAASNSAAAADASADAAAISETNAANSAASAAGLISGSVVPASQAEAEAGTDNVKFMSALRVRQAINSTALGGFKNKIINGQMQIDQRNAGATKAFSTTWPNYGVDRWSAIAQAAVTGTLTMQRVSGDANSQYAMRLAKTAGAYSSILYGIQIIESANCYALAGKTVSLSFRARVGSSFTGTTTPFKSIYTGTGVDQGGAGGIGSWTGASNLTVTTVQNPALTTAFQTYKFTFSIPADATELALFLGRTCDASTGSANDYIDITDVQLEEGAVATPFETRAIGQELALCQRYYYKTFPQGTAPAQNAGITSALWMPANTSASAWTQSAQRVIPVPLRTTPTTLTTYNPQAANANWRNSGNTGDYVVSTLVSTADAISLTAASVASGNGAFIHFTADAEL